MRPASPATLPPDDTRATVVQIVPIGLAHAARFRDCLDAVARERLYLAQTEALPLARIEAFVRDSVAQDAVQFVALAGEQLVGWADIFAAWPESTRHRGTVGMGVLAAWRGQGIGERLLRACLAKAADKGLTRIELEVRADNPRAIRLYERLGFRHEATMVRGIRLDGGYIDALQMSLLLPD